MCVFKKFLSLHSGQLSIACAFVWTKFQPKRIVLFMLLQSNDTHEILIPKEPAINIIMP